MSGFTHLHLHTTYSLLDGQCQIKPLVAKAKSLGMASLAVTDHGNLFALKAFYDECRKKDIKPILGVEAYVTSLGDHTLRHEYFAAHPGLKEKRFHLCLHAKNLIGYHNLVRLMSEAHINGRYYNPRIDHKLIEKYHEGLHCSSACIAGEVQYYLDDDINSGGNDPAKAEEIAKWYKSVFGDDYSLEVMLHRTEKTAKVVRNAAGEVVEQITDEAVLEMQNLYVRQKKVAEKVIALGKKLGIRVIATNDVHFLEKDEDDSHDVLLSLSTQTRLSDPKRMIYTGQEYFKTEEEMQELFPDHPEVIAATQEVADKVETYELNSDPIMPKFPIPAEFGSEEEYAKRYSEAQLKEEFNTEDKPNNFERLGGYEKVLRIKFESDYLERLVNEGAVRRWGKKLPAEIRERLDFELNVIKTMGFPGYFLIVNDYIANARKMGVWVGPGRGSAAGAAVAYALGITNVDPLKFDLLFERFLNPDRISMPDIDVDFDDEGRSKVLEFVTQKYGKDHVAHIVTFGQMAAKSVIKDVGRAMSYPLPDTNRLAALVPETPKITFASATSKIDKKGNPNKGYAPALVEAFNSSDKTIRSLMSRARKLEGGMRQPGVHACGVIISRDPLIETLPVMPTEGESLLTTQYDGHFVEPVGLLKMDFLGLKTLTVEKECVAILGRNNKRVPKELLGADGYLDPDKIPDDDKETYELFGQGKTTGLFQFESEGMMKHLKALRPEKLTDLVAMNALYRPGPMAYIPDFIDRKQGRKPVEYDHPLMERYLKDTYGITVYQEQVMLLSRLLGGFTRGDSDKLRKAMGKKQLDVMEKLKAKFDEGCLKNKEFRIGEWKDEKKAKALIDKIWNDWRAFAEYAFNKSHSVCYAWIAYQTGYLKAHYPAEFMCAQISSEIGNFDKLPDFVAEAQEMGLDLRLPDVNESGGRFVPTPDSKGIRYGLSGIKGVGAAGELIVAEREKNGPFKGFLDYCMRLAGTQACNKRVLENLTRTGAFSTLEPNRGKLFGNIEFALKKAQQKAKDDNSAQGNFFDMLSNGDSGETVSDRELRDIPAFPPAEDLKNERDFLGVYISGHPLQACSKLISEVSTFRFKDLENSEELDKKAEEYYEERKLPDDEWKVRKNPNVKDRRAFRHIDVRIVGQLSSCIIKPGKPNAKGQIENWAILTIDDGTKSRDVFCFAKTWTRFNVRPLLPNGSPDLKAPGSIENAVGQLVVLTGEISRRIDYAKEDRIERKNPMVGEWTFNVKEVFPLTEAMVRISKGVRILLNYNDDLADKIKAIRDAAKSSPGAYPVMTEVVCEDGTKIELDMGSDCHVGLGLSFLSQIAKITPVSNTFYDPSADMMIAPPERRPWERKHD